MSKITKYCLILCNALGGDLNCISFFHFRSQNTGGDYKFIPYVSPTNNLEDTTVAIAFFLIFFLRKTTGKLFTFAQKIAPIPSRKVLKTFLKRSLEILLLRF